MSNTPLDEEELFTLIKEKEKELNVRTRMRAWTTSLRYFDSLKTKNPYFFLLELDTIQEKLLITTFSKRQEEKYTMVY